MAAKYKVTSFYAGAEGQSPYVLKTDDLEVALEDLRDTLIQIDSGEDFFVGVTFKSGRKAG